MNKIPENKTRKRLRITLCILYLFEIVLCAWVYFRFENTDGTVVYQTVFDMLGFLGQQSMSNMGGFSEFMHFIPFCFIFPIVPVIGFFFCALDKERNLKNIVSLLCCLVGVLSILLIVTPSFIAMGSLLSLLLYVLIAFITSFSLMARVADTGKKN